MSPETILSQIFHLFLPGIHSKIKGVILSLLAHSLKGKQKKKQTKKLLCCIKFATGIWVSFKAYPTFISFRTWSAKPNILSCLIFRIILAIHLIEKKIQAHNHPNSTNTKLYRITLLKHRSQYDQNFPSHQYMCTYRFFDLLICLFIFFYFE